MTQEAKLYRSVVTRLAGRWPKPRAMIALDIQTRSDSAQPPRIDTVCKWLLDELGSPAGDQIVYRDDRQVGMLFARMLPRHDGEEPMLSVTARTVSLTLESVRRSHVRKYENWDAFPDDFDLESVSALERRIDNDREFLEATADSAGDDADIDSLRDRARRDVGENIQRLLLRATDDLADHVVLAMAEQRRRGSADVVERALTLLESATYAIRLGRGPNAADRTAQFSARIRHLLRKLKAERPDLFSLRVPVGITIFYTPDERGKDLDNLLMLVCAAVIDEMTPPQRESFFETNPDGVPQVAFIEAIQLPPHEAGDRRGQVLLTLSGGNRFHSRWARHQDYFDD